MSEEEFKEYVKETLSSINSKITKKEQGFINLLGNTFNDVCAENMELQKENEQLKSVLKEIREYIEERYDYEQNVLIHTFDRDNIKELFEITDTRIGENNG